LNGILPRRIVSSGDPNVTHRTAARRRLVPPLALFFGFALVASLPASNRPASAPFRSAFEAQFPKTEASAAALEIERLAAVIGLDLSPMTSTDSSANEPTPTPAKTDEPAPFALEVEKERARPSAEARTSVQRISGTMAQFLDRELKTPEERIGAPPPPLERFFTDHEDDIAALESALVRESDIRWEMDVTAGESAPIPNLGGILRLQRFLAVRALIEARRGDTDAALHTLEGAWRLNEVVSARPELISQLIAVAAAKIHAGVLRKLDSPAWGWADRLRSGDLFMTFLAAFQNQAWFSPDARDLTGEAGTFGRILRQVAGEFEERDLCSWTPEKLRETWTRAVRDQSREGSSAADIAVPNLIESLARWRRYQVDAELTALVLDARAERAASRRRTWPAKLHGIGAGVCPDGPWSYKTSGNGTATFAYEGRIAESPSVALKLPLTFTAGTPTAPSPREPKPGRKRN
jgi:hypothetical protein